MTIDEIKQKTEDKEYDFLRTNPHLRGKITKTARKAHSFEGGMKAPMQVIT